MHALVIENRNTQQTRPNIPFTVVTPTSAAVAASCTACHLRKQCLPGDADGDNLEMLGKLIAHRRRVRRGDVLFRAGDPFKWVYAHRSGSSKTVATTEDGREQVTGFHMVGEIMGLDGIESEQHTLTAVALEDGEVCVFAFNDLADASSQHGEFRNQLFRIMSSEIIRDQNLMLLLGNMRAEERLASFLLNLSKRYSARGYSSVDFILRMTRDEIGSYLGMKLETVSRTFGYLQNLGLISVKQRTIRILDRHGLTALVHPA